MGLVIANMPLRPSPKPAIVSRWLLSSLYGRYRRVEVRDPGKGWSTELGPYVRSSIVRGHKNEMLAVAP